MFFVVKGYVSVMKEDGTTLALLGKGKHFGEMALIKKEPTLRNATAMSFTQVAVAVLSSNNFDLICKTYPAFRQKMEETAKSRAAKKAKGG